MVHATGWSAGEWDAFKRTLTGPHMTRARVELRDFEHRYVGNLSASRMSGQVQVQADSDGATRSLSLEVFDPTDLLGLGDGSAAVTPNRMVQVWRGVHVPEFSRWFDVPIFCGPITKPSRSGDLLKIEAQDKSALADSNATSFTVRKGENAITAMRRLMQAIGETRFRLTSSSARLGFDRVLSADVTPWQACQSIAKGLGWVLFYDGAGYLVCKPRPTAEVFEFRAGLGGTLLSRPDRGFWDNEIVNDVVVTGGTVAGVVIQARATIASANSFSPEKLGRHGKVRRKRETIEDTSLTLVSQARARADRRVKELAVQSSTASLESLCAAYHLEEHDVYVAVDPKTGERTKAAVKEMTIPLDHSGTQSLGFVKWGQRTNLRTRQTSNASAINRARARKKARR